MSLESVPGFDATYHLVPFDAAGRERGRYSQEVLRAAETRSPTDVFVFSHGWNGDIPDARAQYGAWVATMLGCTSDRERAAERPGGFRPLLVGLHWPSKAWGDEKLTEASFGIEQPGIELVDDVVVRLGDDDPAVRAAVRTIVAAYLENAAPLRLPEPVREAYHVINQADPPGLPEADREPFDPERMYQACLIEQAVSYGGLSLGGILAPLRVLTFWQMKRRARTFGESGAAGLVAALQEHAPQARVHLMGHSFGCIVACAAVTGARRPVHSLALVQGAMSLWSFCSSIPAAPERAGYFHRIVADSLVSGPSVITTSPFDRAVGTFYPLGARSGRQVDFAPGELPKYGAIGTFGIQGSDLTIVESTIDTVDDLRPRTLHNLDARTVIATPAGISGAHSDICHPQVAHAIWSAALA